MIYMIIFVMHDPECLDRILSAWDQAGTTGVTILPSTGLGRLSERSALREDMPLIPYLQDLEAHIKNLNRTIFTIVEGEELVERIVRVTQEIVGDLNQPNTGILAVLPVSRVYGLDRHQE